jgi:hypothetical protein
MYSFNRVGNAPRACLFVTVHGTIVGKFSELAVLFDRELADNS